MESLPCVCQQDCHDGVLWQERPLSGCFPGTILFQVRQQRRALD